MGHTIQLDLPDSIYEALTQTARQTGQRPEAIATQWLIAAAHQFADDPLERFIGAFDSQGIDWVDKHDSYLGGALLEPRPSTPPNDSSDG
jgi:hypothetical protein